MKTNFDGINIKKGAGKKFLQQQTKKNYDFLYTILGCALLGLALYGAIIIGLARMGV